MPASSHITADVTDCGQLQTKKNIDSRTSRSAGWPVTKPAPFEAVSAAGERLIGKPALGLGDAKLAALMGRMK